MFSGLSSLTLSGGGSVILAEREKISLQCPESGHVINLDQSEVSIQVM